MKSQAKKAVAKWKFECRCTGGGRNLAPKPTEIQFRIASFIGEIHTSGIPGIANCDATAQAQQQVQIQINFVTIPMVTGGDEGTISVMVIEPSPPLHHHHYHL